MIRKIHLDFHTAADVMDVGAEFDAERFAQMLSDAHVSDLATPGKCQFGHTYFDTALGQPHPHLVRPDLFPATVKACNARGIRVQAYFTLGLDDVTASGHPDWRQRRQDGTYAQWGAKHICFASPYVDEVVVPEVLELIDRSPGIYGFWFDICLYDSGAFYSEYFEEAARRRLGASSNDQRQRWLLGRQLIGECCQRIDTAVRSRLPDAENYFNSLVTPGEAQYLALQRVPEVENPILFGGPEVMTVHARWLRSHSCRPVGLVSRFHGPWMDPGTVRTSDQIRFDVGRVVSLGCGVSMGDHRHPDGTLDPLVYQRVGKVYGELARCQQWLDSARPCCEALLLSDVERDPGQLFPKFPSTTLHAARMLEEIGLQFDVASVEEELPAVDLIIWPGRTPASPKLRSALERHAASGGAILAMGHALESCASLFGVPNALPLREESSDGSATRISEAGHVVFDASTDVLGEGRFVRLSRELDASGFAHVLPRGVVELAPLRAVQVLAELLPAVSLNPPCPARQAIGPVITACRRAIYSGIPLCDVDANSGTTCQRHILRALCDRLLPQRLVRHDGGDSLVAHLHRLPGGYLLHLLHWAMDRQGGKPDCATAFPPVGPIEVAVRTGPVRRVTLEPSGERLTFTWRDSVCRFTVASMKVWQLIRLETVDSGIQADVRT